ncbi:hypothetical protein PUN28_002084 [Cardiocondyla obscurior]|uniref:CCHC-type domain-containing protein n=1 Tax=Cardiocondyla obscurior TaxID=286306 RepID=A0AAW2GSP8_9HYME
MTHNYSLLDGAGGVPEILIDREVNALRELHTATPNLTQRQERLMKQVLENLREMNFRIIRFEQRPNESRETIGNQELIEGNGRAHGDVRNRPTEPASTFKLKDARAMIPTVDGTNHAQTKEFLKACAYAAKHVTHKDTETLLEAVLCTKLKGAALLDFDARDITTFDQFLKEFEKTYLRKKGTSRLQTEMSALKQKYGESATTYGQRVQKTAMELYEAMTDEEEMTSEQKRTVLKLIQPQALHYFHMGLTDDIKTMVRSQHFETLKDAIKGAVEEEKIRVTKHKGTYEKTRTNETHEKPRSSSITCNKCGKAGHIARECRSNRHINGFNLPRAETRARINNTEKFCTHCRKPGHTRDECWSVNGRPDTR